MSKKFQIQEEKRRIIGLKIDKILQNFSEPKNRFVVSKYFQIQEEARQIIGLKIAKGKLLA